MDAPGGRVVNDPVENVFCPVGKGGTPNPACGPKKVAQSLRDLLKKIEDRPDALDSVRESLNWTLKPGKTT